MSGPAMQTFREELYVQLATAKSVFGADRLEADQIHVQATGRFQVLNRTSPGEFSCRIFRDAPEGTSPKIFPLIAHFSEEENPQSRYARAIESALLSEESPQRST